MGMIMISLIFMIYALAVGIAVFVPIILLAVSVSLFIGGLVGKSKKLLISGGVGLVFTAIIGYLLSYIASIIIQEIDAFLGW